MTTEDKELKKITDDMIDIGDALWEQEIELNSLSRKPINGEPTKMRDLDWELIENCRRLVSLASHQLHVLRVDLEARMD